MNLSRSKSALALILFTAAGVAAAVLAMPESAVSPSTTEHDSTHIQPELTNVSTIVLASNQEVVFVPIDQFMIIPPNSDPVRINLAAIDEAWSLSYAPFLIESMRFMPRRSQNEVITFLENKTNQRFGLNFDLWFQWIWKQDFKPHPDIAKLKSKLYSQFDPRFPEYFSNTDGATIRLDEIRWGGVRRDGIPPLKNPQMISAARANYLSDSDVVFGVDINGDSRCYPKRILAWHEMFKDTIGGESVCGVY